jgi:hypothetical protein
VLNVEKAKLASFIKSPEVRDNAKDALLTLEGA